MSSGIVPDGADGEVPPIGEAAGAVESTASDCSVGSVVEHADTVSAIASPVARTDFTPSS